MINILKTPLVLSCLTVGLLSCSNEADIDKADEKKMSELPAKSIEFVIVDVDTFSNNNLAYSIYASDTNWIELAKFADSLLLTKGRASSVAYFNSLANTPKLNYGGFDQSYLKYNTSGYALDYEDGLFKLYHGGSTTVLPDGKKVPVKELVGVPPH